VGIEGFKKVFESVLVNVSGDEVVVVSMNASPEASAAKISDR
jgi:hypothetical protein